jgi:ammonia channel protein AmtB
VDGEDKETDLFPFHSFFYSGLARRKSALSFIWLSIMATAVISFQWFFGGWSFTFLDPGNRKMKVIELP